MQTDNLELDSKLLGDCLMSLAVFQAWQEPLYTHMVAQARSLPMAAYGPRSLRQTYQVSQTCNYGYTGWCNQKEAQYVSVSIPADLCGDMRVEDSVGSTGL